MKEIMGIANEQFALQKIIESSPKLGMFAEAFKNAQEAGATKLLIDTIKIGGAYKAVLINDGLGMDEETIYGMTNVMDFAKSKNNKDENNFNNGIRIMGMPNNEKGLIFISKHSGVIRSIALTLEEGIPYSNIDEHIIDVGKEYGFEDGDWTALLLMGNSVRHPTLSKPYGNLTGKLPFEEQALLRFYNPTMRVYFGKRRFKPLAERYINARHWEVKVNDDITIHYRLVKDDNDPVNGILTKKNEIFSPEVGNGRSKHASSAMSLYGILGAYACSKELSILVEVSDRYANQDMRRDSLLDEGGNNIDLRDFYPQIERYIPSELKQYIDEKADKKAEREISSLTEEFVKNMMDELGLSLDRLVADKDGMDSANRKEPKRRDVPVPPNPNPNPSDKTGDKPTPAERKKGMPEIEAEFLTTEQLENEDFKQHELGYVVGHKAYFKGGHPFLKFAVKAVRTKRGMEKIDRKAIEGAFISYISKAYVLALPFKLTKEQSGAVLLAVASEALANSTFVDRFVKDNRKG